MSERACPHCRQSLSSARLGPINLAPCRNCGGIWFECGTLARVISAGPQVMRKLCDGIRPSSTEGTRPIGPPYCPGCRVPLANVEYESMPGVSLDTCRFCEGFWVSHGSLLRLTAALEGASRWEPVEGRAAAAPPAQPPAPEPATAPPPPQPAAEPEKVLPRAATETENCPHCGQPNAERAAVCWACGRPLKGTPVGACPRCEATMRRIDSGGVTMDGCEGCGGVYITPNRLNALTRQTTELQVLLLGQVSRFRTERMKRVHPEPGCPHCKTLMRVGRLGMLTQMPVWNCPQCFGLFLEHGVLEDILLGQKSL
jgi:Zn-finger nucleic acid-binding protein